MVNYCILVLCTLFVTSFVTALEIKCSYQNQAWEIGSIKSCYLKNNLNILTPDSEVISMNSNVPSDVNGFYSYDQTIHFFPKGLDKIFGDIIFILIQLGPIKEVHEEDLAPFPKLKLISLALNEIEIIEDGLFQHNTELEVVSLRDNRIFQIYPKVFENLNKLKYLKIGSNQCTNENISNDRTEVLAYIIRLKLSCSNTYFLNLSEKLKILKADFKELSLDNFSTFNSSLKEFKSELKSSIMSSSYVMNKMVDDFDDHINGSTHWNLILKNFTTLQNLQELGLENVKSDLNVCQKSIEELKQQFLTFVPSENIQKQSCNEGNNITKKIETIEKSITDLNNSTFEAFKHLQIEISNDFNQKLFDFANETENKYLEKFENIKNSEKCSLNSIELAYQKIDKTNSIIQNNSRLFEERIKSIENELKFPSTKAIIRTGLVLNKMANFEEMNKKIDDLQSEMLRGYKNFDNKLKMTESLTKALEAKVTKKTENIDRTVKNFLEQSFEKIENFQTEAKKDFRKVDKKLLDQEDLITEINEKIEKNQNDIRNTLMRTEERIEILEKSLKSNQESLTSFRSEVSDIFNKILEKFETSSENIELIIPERLESRSLNEQNYVKILNEKVKNLEKSFNDLKFEVFNKQKLLCESCDSD